MKNKEGVGTFVSIARKIPEQVLVLINSWPPRGSSKRL